jgi:hypothetical protein
MKCVSIRTSGFIFGALALATTQACSSAEESDQDVGSLMGIAGSPAPAAMGGMTATGAAGSPSTPAPGSSGSGGAASTEGNPPVSTPPAAGGAANSGAMTGSGGAAGGATLPPPADAICAPGDPSPSDGVACMITCTDPCGIKNLGTRLCSCTAAVFDCASCEFNVDSPLLDPPTAPLPDCALSDDLQEDDESGCMDNVRCQSIGRTPGAMDGGNRFCGCLGGTWDCDTKPESFGG